MLLEEIKNIKSEKKDLRNFGITFGVVSSLLGAALWWKGKDTYTICAILSIAFFFLGFILPGVLKPLQRAWMAFAVVLGFIMTKVILSILFYLVFTSIGLGARLFGKKFLDIKMNKSRESYWRYRQPKPFDKSNYEKQF